jgi:hypothetical protein
MKIKNKIIALMISLMSIPNLSLAQTKPGEVKIGIDVGYAFADIDAKNTAQAIANATGSTTTATYDEATWMIRPFAGYGFTKELSGEIGLFYTGTLDANYRTASGVTASESYKAFGIDLSPVYTFPGGMFVKAGLHYGKIDGAASARLSSGASVTVTGYSYGVNSLVGIGYESPNGFRIGYTFYNDVGDLAGADFGMLYVGAKF